MLTGYQIVQWWLRSVAGRKVELSHGGDGGTFYANLITEDGDSLIDGHGDTLEAAMEACSRAIHIEDLMAEGGDK